MPDEYDIWLDELDAELELDRQEAEYWDEVDAELEAARWDY